MPNLYNVKDKISEMFGNLVNKNLISLYVDTITQEFSQDFPCLKSIYINNNSNGDRLFKIDINEIDSGFISIIGYIYGRNLLNVNNSYDIFYGDRVDIYERITIDIYSKLLFLNTSSYIQLQPIIDSTTYYDTSSMSIVSRSLIGIPKKHMPVLLFYYSKRNMTDIILNGIEIEPWLYNILEDYLIYKIIDYLFLENVEQLNNKIVDLWNKNYDMVLKAIQDSSADKTNYEQLLSSINLGGISMSFDNNMKTNNLKEYSGILERILNSTRDLLNSYKDFYYKIRNDKYKGFINKKKNQLFGLSSISL